MGNRPYKLERSNVDLPLWRKKVDATIVIAGETPVPNWVANMWGVSSNLIPAASRNDARSLFKVNFKKKQYGANLYQRKANKNRARVYLSFDPVLRDSLAHTFSMTWARAIEGELRSSESDFVAEDAIPFWEFLDIECDAPSRTLKLTAHYRQEPIFPSLFKALLSPENHGAMLSTIENKRGGKDRPVFSGWVPRDNLAAYRAVNNAVYVLLDRAAKLIYVGQVSTSLVSRLQPKSHPNIQDWDHFSYCQVPNNLIFGLDSIERMLILNYSLLFENDLGTATKSASEYRLVNKNKGS